MTDINSTPITADMLRDDWHDHPLLARPEVRQALEAMTEEQLDRALVKAFRDVEDMWFHVLDSTRRAATEALMEAAGFDLDN